MCLPSDRVPPAASVLRRVAAKVLAQWPDTTICVGALILGSMAISSNRLIYHGNKLKDGMREVNDAARSAVGTLIPKGINMTLMLEMY